MNIPVLTMLQSKLSDLKERLKLTGVIDCYSTKPPRKSRKLDYTTTFELSDVIEYINRWINSTDCAVQPTWKNFFRILKDTSPELGELAYQIKELFHGKLFEIC